MSLTRRERAIIPAALVELADNDPGKWLAAAKDHARQLSGVADSATTAKLPPLWKQALTFARALARHIKAGLPKATQALAERRLAICEQCPRFQVDGSRCGVCGCAMRLKAAWEQETCPEGRW
jgi:hypothetical protein